MEENCSIRRADRGDKGSLPLGASLQVLRRFCTPLAGCRLVAHAFAVLGYSTAPTTAVEVPPRRDELAGESPTTFKLRSVVARGAAQGDHAGPGIRKR